MKYFRSLFVMAAVALAWMAAIPAYAIGTVAGTPVTNAVTLDYKVNGFDQTQQNASVQFVVDRAVATLVAAQGANAVQVTPGQTSAAAALYPALNFDVTNTGNDLQDLWLALIDRGATTVNGLGGQGSGAAFVDPTPIVAIDMNNNGLYDLGTDTVLTPTSGHYVLSNVVHDTTQRILVVVNVPTAALNGARDAFTLVAGVAIAGGGAFIGGDTNGHNSPGFAVATNDADVIGTVQNVFTDVSPSNLEDLSWNFQANTAGAQDVIYNGQHADTSAFVVRAAQLYVGKTVEVLWDPVNGNRYNANNSDTPTTNNPKAIPGAVVMYAIGVQNDTGSPNATGININDDLQNGAILVGNPGGAPVAVPDHVSVTLNSVSVPLDVPNTADLAVVNTRDCTGAVSTAAFNVGNPEVSTNLGTCAATQTGVIVYFVTLQ